MNTIARFTADLARVFPEGLGPDRPFALAVSGGPDSMAMLWLAAQAFPGQVIAATVDHRLRPESAGEAAMVAEWCAAADVPHAILTVETPPGASGNLQSWARQERYFLLKRWAIERGASVLATAHHAEDQAETFLMRAARGSGLSGLAAIRERLNEEIGLSSSEPETGPEGVRFTAAFGTLAIVRPLLGWRRGELRALCEEQGLPFMDDASNVDERFDRTRFRSWLGRAEWLDPVAIGRSAAYLAESDRDLHEVSRWLYAQRRMDGSPYEEKVDVAELPRGVRRLLARIAIEDVRLVNEIRTPAWSRATNIEPLLDALESGRAATQAGVLATPKGSVWHFHPAPPRRSP